MQSRKILTVFFLGFATLVSASDAEPPFQASVKVNTKDVYYTLPQHVWGMKFVGYEHERVNDEKTKSADGKTYSQLILDLKMIG